MGEVLARCATQRKNVPIEERDGEGCMHAAYSAALALLKANHEAQQPGAHRCLKNISTAMAMDRDETYKSHAY